MPAKVARRQEATLNIANLTELALLGALSLRTGSAIRWDATAMKAVDLPAADAIIKESYRSGWEIPRVG